MHHEAVKLNSDLVTKLLSMLTQKVYISFSIQFHLNGTPRTHFNFAQNKAFCISRARSRDLHLCKFVKFPDHPMPPPG